MATALRLIRYIKSAGFGLQVEATQFRHAVQILGYQKLTRWLLLLLATSNKNAPPALAKVAISLGRFMELLGKSTLEQTEANNLFLTGIFALLRVDMPSILPTLELPDDVGAAESNPALLEAASWAESFSATGV